MNGESDEANQNIVIKYEKDLGGSLRWFNKYYKFIGYLTRI